MSHTTQTGTNKVEGEEIMGYSDLKTLYMLLSEKEKQLRRNGDRKEANVFICYLNLIYNHKKTLKGELWI